jgi:molybdopterin/thiamine biosynthesis adenylyltransferase
MDGGLSEGDRAFFRRNILLEEMGEDGQRKLLASRVLLVGLGGLGSPALLYLTAAGVGEMVVMDGDRVEPSNLQRQILYGESDIGLEKAVCARDRARRIRSDVRISIHPGRFSAHNARRILAGCDFVIEATDNLESKLAVNDACVALGVPFSHAGVTGLQGQTLTVVPGRSPCVRCVFGDLPDADADGDGGGGEQGILGPVAGVMGAIQAVEAVKCLVGFGQLLAGQLLTWNARTMDFRRVPLPPEPSCKVCRKRLGELLDDEP